MYGVERSIVTFSRLVVLVGSVDGRIMLEVNGRSGVSGAGVEVLRAGSVLALAGFSQAVCLIVSNEARYSGEIQPCLYRLETLTAGLYS